MAGIFFDSHCHFDFADFDHDRQQLWQACLQQGVAKLLIPGVNPSQWLKAAELCFLDQNIYFAAGLHPWWQEKLSSEQLATFGESLAAMLQQPDCVALGECGLDAMITLPLEKQQLVFEQQLALACDSQLPLIIHVRKTHAAVLALLKRYQPAAGGVIHGFSGSYDIARAYWQLGFYLGVGGTISYSRARKTRQAIAAMPLESLLLETDAPDMPLSGRQGERNSPLYLPEVAGHLATIKALSVADIARQTTDNACQLFRV